MTTYIVINQKTSEDIFQGSYGSLDEALEKAERCDPIWAKVYIFEEGETMLLRELVFYSKDEDDGKWKKCAAL